jgi:L-rhamnose mutarotase
MKRVCFTLRVRPEMLDEYRQRHNSVWPEMLEALRETGWTNYSLFLSPDGLLIGYLETLDFEKSLAGMAAREVNQRWQTSMAPFFLNGDQKAADEQMTPLEEVFHVD